MKKRHGKFNKMVAFFAFAVLAFVGGSLFAAGGAILEGLAVGGTLTAGAVITANVLPIWFKMVDGVKTFLELSEDEVKGLTAEERSLYYKAAHDHVFDTVKSLQETIVGMENKDPEKLEKALDQLKNYETMFETLKATQLNQGEIIAEMKKNGSNAEQKVTFEGLLKSAWDEKAEDLSQALSGEKGMVSMNINKAEQTYGDINSGLDFAQMRPGVIDIPVRRPRVRSLFRTTPVNTEFVKYVEQDTVIRDAQNVAKCAAVTSTTKETLIVRNIETKVIKDQISFCRLFVDDYPFMRERINRLLTQSIELREDDQLLLGDNTGNNTNSIDNVASEFSAANPACDISASVDAATYVDLILGMRTQIVKLGQQDAYMPDTVLVELCDWFKLVESRKDADGNYIDSRVSNVNGQPFIGGMQVIPLHNVAANTCYVFDSTKGEVLDRMMLELELAFQNKDNWEKEIADLKGFIRINFWVPNNWANAFMKCSDVATAIAAIDKP